MFSINFRFFYFFFNFNVRYFKIIVFLQTKILIHMKRFNQNYFIFLIPILLIFIGVLFSSCSSKKYRANKFPHTEVYYQNHKKVKGQNQPIKHNIKVKYTKPPKQKAKRAYKRKL